MNIDDISYEWCFGKPCGTILKDNKTVLWRTSVNKKQISRSFAISKYNNSFEEAEHAARTYGKQWSDENGHTRNQIRRLPDGVYWKDDPKNGPVTKNTLEVQIDKDYTMLVDFDDLSVVTDNNACKTKGGKATAQYYAAVSFKGTREDKKNGKKMIQLFHKFLTGNDMTDHINRNTMDNRRCNLRETTKKVNNNNRSCVCPGMKDAPPDIERVPGVRLVKDRPGGAWQARIKQDNKEHIVAFSVKKHGNHEACRLAVEARKNFSEQFNCLNSN